MPLPGRRALLEAAAVLVPAGAVLLGEAPFAWSVPAALVACALLPLRHVWPPLGLLGGLWGLAGGLGWPPAIVALYTMGRRCRHLPSLVPWAAAAVLVAVTPVLMTQDLGWNKIVLAFGFVGLYAGAPAVMGLLVSTRSRLTESLRELERAREDALAASRDAARAQERARIGREIHDAVGHHATLIAVGAAAIVASTAEDETRRGAEQLRVLAKRALAEMRAALGLLDGTGHAAGLAEITALVAGSRSAGVAVEREDRGEPVGVAPGTGRAAYCVVQESLTNAARHAPGARVCVRLHWHPTELVVEVANDAPVASQSRAVTAGGGAGLTGLSERVGATGGELVVGPREGGGFTVRATFPLEPHPAGALAPALDPP
ncbi:histidine kinase [Pseudonocardia sp. MH-G8]|nr:histidine kinase [Pseudonocardia sp. MH-G8]